MRHACGFVPHVCCTARACVVAGVRFFLCVSEGSVKLVDLDVKIKFHAAEVLRCFGGLDFDALGNRYANELGRQEYVTGEMWKDEPPSRLSLNKAASDEIAW